MKLVLVIVALGIAALAFGCSDSSDALTIEEYFAEFEAIDAELGTQFFEGEVFAELDDFPDEEFFADDTNLSLSKEFVAAFPRLYADAVDSYKTLDPPSDVETEHDDFVAAGEDFVVAWEEAADVLDEAETGAELVALMEEVEASIEEAEARFDEPCFEIVDVGEANGIAVDVTCEDRR